MKTFFQPVAPASPPTSEGLRQARLSELGRLAGMSSTESARLAPLGGACRSLIVRFPGNLTDSPERPLAQCLDSPLCPAGKIF